MPVHPGPSPGPCLGCQVRGEIPILDPGETFTTTLRLVPTACGSLALPAVTLQYSSSRETEEVTDVPLVSRARARRVLVGPGTQTVEPASITLF